MTGKLTRWSIFLQEYDFDFVYRKGSKHGNVDAISRPVIDFVICMTTTQVLNDKIKLDVWENPNLIHFIQFWKLVPGISKKLATNIQNLAKNYRFENNKLFIHKTGKYLEVPKPELRAEIFEKAHNFGHFQTESTYQRLKDTFYW